jgi:hypothetical protein
MRHLLVIVLLLVVDPAMAVEPTGNRTTPDLRPHPTVRLRNTRMLYAVTSALTGARQRLASPRCGRLFSAIKDRQGNTLSQNLGALGHTPASYLRLVLFYDGTGQAPCQHRKVLAVTTVGSRVVFVCSQFADAHHRDPVFAESVIIHEMLHSLGLDHDKPSSNAITGLVKESCCR